MVMCTPHAIMPCYAIRYKEQFLNSLFWLNLSPMDIITIQLWLIPSRDISWIPLLLSGIHSISSPTGLPTTITITMIMALISMVSVSMTLTLSPNIYAFGLLQHYLAKQLDLPQQQHLAADFPQLQLGQPHLWPCDLKLSSVIQISESRVPPDS